MLYITVLYFDTAYVLHSEKTKFVDVIGKVRDTNTDLAKRHDHGGKPNKNVVKRKRV